MAHEAAAPYGRALQDAVGALERLGYEGVGQDPARYEAVAEGMKQALAALPQRHARKGLAGRA